MAEWRHACRGFPGTAPTIARGLWHISASNFFPLHPGQFPWIFTICFQLHPLKPRRLRLLCAFATLLAANTAQAVDTQSTGDRTIGNLFSGDPSGTSSWRLTGAHGLIPPAGTPIITVDAARPKISTVISITGTLALADTNTCTAVTQVSAGILNVTGSLPANTNQSALTVSANNTGATTLAAPATGGVPTHSSGSTTHIAATRTFETTLDCGTGSIFEWVPASHTAEIANHGETFDGVDKTNPNVTRDKSASIFKTVFGNSVSFNPAVDTDLFWNAARSWKVFGDGSTSRDRSIGSYLVLDSQAAIYIP